MLFKEKIKVRGGRGIKLLSSCVRWRRVEIIIEWAREWQAVEQRYGKKWKLIYVWKFTLLYFLFKRYFRLFLCGCITSRWWSDSNDIVLRDGINKHLDQRHRSCEIVYFYFVKMQMFCKKGIGNCSSDSSTFHFLWCRSSHSNEKITEFLLSKKTTIKNNFSSLTRSLDIILCLLSSDFKM